MLLAIAESSPKTFVPGATIEGNLLPPPPPSGAQGNSWWSKTRDGSGQNDDRDVEIYRRQLIPKGASEAELGRSMEDVLRAAFEWEQTLAAGSAIASIRERLLKSRLGQLSREYVE